MLICKKESITILLYGLFYISSCSPVIKELSYSGSGPDAKSLNANFISVSLFDLIPELSQNYNEFGNFEQIDSFRIYKATFKVSLIEDNSYTLTPALLSPNSQLKGVDYYSFQGDLQEIYLIRLYTNNPETYPYIYASAKYNADGVCTGLGPAYFGYVYDERNYIIDIDLQLIVKKRKGKYTLVKDNYIDLSFIFDDNLINSSYTDNSHRLKKVLLKSSNKIGSNRPVIFPIDAIFNSNDAIDFIYVGSSKLD